jgi:hypothetical protein
MPLKRPPTPFVDEKEMATFIPSSDSDMFDNYEEDSYSHVSNIREIHDEAIDEEAIDTEKALNNLDEFDNLTQLKILRSEINHIILHNVIPDEGWFDERFVHIRIYSQLGWFELAHRFYGKDDFMFNKSKLINTLCIELLEEYSTKPNFTLNKYHTLINEISNIWQYYYKKYMGAEQDNDIINLIEEMTHLWR